MSVNSSYREGFVPGKIKMRNLKLSMILIDFLSDKALDKFIELVGIETYPNPRRRWPELRTEVAGGEHKNSKMGFVVRARFEFQFLSG